MERPRPEILIMSASPKGRALAAFIQITTKKSVLLADSQLRRANLLANQLTCFDFDKLHSSYVQLPIRYSGNLKTCDFSELSWIFYIGEQPFDQKLPVFPKGVISVADTRGLSKLRVDFKWEVQESRLAQTTVDTKEGFEIISGSLEDRRKFQQFVASLGISVLAAFPRKSWKSWTDNLEVS